MDEFGPAHDRQDRLELCVLDGWHEKGLAYVLPVIRVGETLSVGLVRCDRHHDEAGRFGHTRTLDAPFFLAAVMTNDGCSILRGFGQPNFEDAKAVIAPEHALRGFDLMPEEPAHFREAARQRRHEDTCVRQYDFNPFVAKPFVTMPDGTDLAP
ncbi:hypothetical protein [Nocardioides sp. LHG3406-4]|uniref:hypothetical protein n=1 Tax=Nocardioides sp. LHG3406-4 TaxID=2804575 RepID=UPI003CF6570D